MLVDPNITGVDIVYDPVSEVRQAHFSDDINDKEDI